MPGSKGFPGGSVVKEPACQCKRSESDLQVRKIPWRREWWPTPVFLPGESHGQRCLGGCSPWGRKTARHDWVTKHARTGNSIGVDFYHQDSGVEKMRFTGVKWLTHGNHRANNCRGWDPNPVSLIPESTHGSSQYNACHPPSHASWGQRLVSGCRDTKPELLNLSCHRILWQASL